ncbi:unnamed protein product, partial [Ascophyllum nodosum]
MANDDWDGAVPMNKALKALATSVRPISASRVKTAAATALENVKEYKRVVYAIERFIRKAPPQHRIGGCFVIDSVCRQAQSKWGHKDVFTPRFAQRMATETVEMLRRVPDDDKPPVFRVIREWHEKGIFKGLGSFAAGGGEITGGSSSRHHRASRASADSSARLSHQSRLRDGGIVNLGLHDGDSYSNAYPRHSDGNDPLGASYGLDSSAAGGGRRMSVDGEDEPLSDSRFVPKEPPLPEQDPSAGSDDVGDVQQQEYEPDDE